MLNVKLLTADHKQMKETIMKISIPLILMGSFVVIGIGVYTLSSDTTVHGNTVASTVDITNTGHIAFDEGGRTVNDVETVLREFAVLRSELATLNPTIQRLNLEVGVLKVKLAALSNQLSDGENSDSTSSDTSDHGDQASFKPETAADMIALNKEELKKDDEHIDVIKNAFQTQDTDEQWSADVTESIAAVFADKSFSNTALSQVQCRSTLCVVEVEHGDSSAADEFDLEFQIQIGSKLPRTNYTSSQNDDGSVTVTMYMAREGYEFPQVE
jgi:hypothetical protein